MKVLITGGAGYIGSTIASALSDNGHTPVLLDSLVTGASPFTKNHVFYKGDIADELILNRIFSDHSDILACIHCAALVVVPESVSNPYLYYSENVSKSLDLFNHLSRLGCHRIVFSSSASVYAATPEFVAMESSALAPLSPYARTKFMMEMVLEDMCVASDLKGLVLRYFNPIGADPKMRSGIHVRRPSHVLGKLVSTALGQMPTFEITGTGWPTRDGSGLRDYVHVWDLAIAHVRAVERFDEALKGLESARYGVINIGTGSGVTVKELVSTFERVWGAEISKSYALPRPGDVVGAYANADRALELLGWKAERSLEEGIASALEWSNHRIQVLGYE